MNGHETQRSLHRLMDRFESLEASHQNLQQQFQLLVEEKTGNGSSRASPGNEEMASDSESMASFPGLGCFPGSYFFGSPYRSVLEYMGHAVHVTRAGSGEIIYWNFAAEKLYGYKDYEAVGQSAVELLFDEEHHGSVIEIMDRVSSGESWSGQLPLNKRSGESFMAMVSKSPLYEEGKLTGIITVSSDAAVFNNTSSGNNRKHNQNRADGQTKFRRINLKKIQWHPQAQALAVPELSSSISNLASKVLLRKRDDVTSDTREIEESEVETQDAKADRPPRVPIRKPSFGFSLGKNKNEGISSQKEDSTSVYVQPPKIAVKLLSKLQRGPIGNPEKVVEDDIQQTSTEDNRMIKNAVPNEPYFHKKYMGSESVASEPNVKSVDSVDTRPDSPNIPSLGNGSESGPHSSSTTRSENDCHVVTGPEIRWEDIQLKEEIGRGSFAAVHRGVWSGLDVAVKVYCGGQYSEETLVDYKKEIDIMRRLRHPNVLLFMGAMCTRERLAMVTEYLSRGSLFKTLHRNSQSLDIKRRLRMATDVARGMNYLHHRNPPIVHRDLKSSNLLVDKSWTVKVGDFGLSKLKYATFLTAKSGRGTPQWMAPEVLRNEPSTEKSDVFSFGVILWELMTERIPWDDLNSLQVVGVVGFMDRRLDLPDNIDPRVRSIISDCWRSNPEDRPSFEDIIRKMMTSLVHTRGNVVAKTHPTT